MYQNSSKKPVVQNRYGQYGKKRKKGNIKMQFLLLALILLLTIGGIFVAVYLLSGYNSRNTFEYQYNESVTAYNAGEYDKALTYIERAIELEEGNESNLMLAWNLQYSILVAKKDYNGAIKTLLKLLEKEETANRYARLLELYSLTGNYDQIDELAIKLEDTQYYEIYKNYMVGSISASIPSGEFTTYINIELIASKPDLVIHYTLDGSKPTVESDVYNNPIEIKEEGVYELRAIGVNAKGALSEEFTETYTVVLKKPDEPIVTPVTGEYYDTVTVEINGFAEGDKVYYTLDGTKPTSDSYEYTEPIVIKAGNYVMGAIAVNEKGIESDVVWRIYDCSTASAFSYDAALWKLRTKLVEDGTMLDMEGNTSEGKIIKVYFVDFALMDDTGKVYLEDSLAKTLEDVTALTAATGKRYYVFSITSEYNGLVEKFDRYYLISVDDGTLLEVNSIN